MNNVLNIAHRGARSLAPENTLAAGQKALDCGADMWEIDVGVTADGELIILHDDSLARTTNVQTIFPNRAPWHAVEFTLAEIKQLDAGSFFVEADPFGQIAAGAVTPPEQAAMRSESIPTLRQALLFTRSHNWRVNVEIKTMPASVNAAQMVEKVTALIEELDMVERVLLSSFTHAYLRQAKALNPAIAIGALCDTPVDNPVALLTELRATAFHPLIKTSTPEQIAAVRAAGFEVNVWTVNERPDMEQLIRAGATGLLTDFPQRLQQILSG